MIQKTTKVIKDIDMKQKLIFASDAGFSFYSASPAIDVSPTRSLIVTRTHNLVYLFSGQEKASISLKESLNIAEGEWIRAAKSIGNDQLFLVTSKLRFFLLDVNFQNKSIDKAVPLDFRYGANLNGQTVKIRILLLESLMLFIADNIMFSFCKTNFIFRIFKLFNEPIVDACLSVLDSNELFVLTPKKVLLLKVLPNKETFVSQIVASQHIEAKSIASLPLGAALLIQDQVIQIFFRASLDLSSRYNFSAGPNPSEIFAISSIDESLLLISKNSLFVANENLSGISYVLSLKSFNYLAVEGRTIELQAKSDSAQVIGVIGSVRYTEDDMMPRFLRYPIELQLWLVFAHLSKQFFGLTKISNYNKVIQELLYGLNLRGDILRHPKFKSHVLRLFALVKDFTTFDQRNKTKEMSVVSPSLKSSSISPDFSYSHVEQLSEEEMLKKTRNRMSEAQLKFVCSKVREKERLSPDPDENALIKFNRAVSQVEKYKNGVSSIRSLLNSSIDPADKLKGLIHMSQYFNMKPDQKYLFDLLLERDMKTSLSKASRILNESSNEESE